MADLGGLEVLKTLRQLDEHARVIVVSADVQRSTEQSVKAAGAERFLAKPTSAEQLATTISDVLGAARP
jgi:CheY-like chemotaxis protein